MQCPDIVVIEALGNRVGGIARPGSGPAVFVRGALPGEKVRVGKAVAAKKHLEAELLSIETPSQYRTKPFCEYYGVCGGCSLQHLEYERQLFWKREWVAKALRKLKRVPDVEYPMASPKTSGYRNRSTFEVNGSRLAMHAFRGDPVVVEGCPLMNDFCRSALNELVRKGIPPGVCRVSARGGENTGQAGVELWCQRPPSLSEFPYPVHWGGGTRWNSLNGGTTRERIGQLVFPVPPGGFFQVNTSAAEILMKTVTDMVSGSGKSILDLYGGVGTLGLPLARAGHRVTSVEMNRQAWEGCLEAIRLNCLDADALNAVNTRDSSYLSRALDSKLKHDVIVTDPPRAGMGIRISRQLRRLGAGIIIYVSCNPFSAARDLEVITEGGYTLSRVVTLDMFPHTDHIETIFLLERS